MYIYIHAFVQSPALDSRSIYLVELLQQYPARTNSSEGGRGMGDEGMWGEKEGGESM